MPPSFNTRDGLQQLSLKHHMFRQHTPRRELYRFTIGSNQAQRLGPIPSPSTASHSIPAVDRL